MASVEQSNRKKPTDQSLDQRRAAHAWAHTEGADGDFKNLASGAPALIMSNGLMQVLAFYKDKNRGHHGKLLKAVIEWVGPNVFGNQCATFEQLMPRLQAATLDEYLRATEEALEVLRWVRQFAKARAQS